MWVGMQAPHLSLPQSRGGLLGQGSDQKPPLVPARLGIIPKVLATSPYCCTLYQGCPALQD